MPKYPSFDPDGPGVGSFPVARVSRTQAKLRCSAAPEPGRWFDDPFNLVYLLATLIVAFERVTGHRGARCAGVDGLRVADVEAELTHDISASLVGTA